MIEDWVFNASLAPTVAAFGWIAIRQYRHPDLSRGPRQMRLYARTLFYCGLAPIAVYAYQLLYTSRGIHPGMYLPAVGFVLFVAGCGYVAFLRRQTKREVTWNYVEDPRYCGQCGYDLTGNISGICPECGWRIPKTTGDKHLLRWPPWWKQWRIPYLPRWRLALLVFALVTIATTGLAVWIALYTHSILATALVSLFALNALITVVRIADHAHHERRGMQRDKQ